LKCNDNQLTSLDVSNNTALEDLICFNNQLTSLDLSNNIALSYLYCSYNQLTSLDITNNIVLVWLNCNYNQLTSLDVTNNIALSYLYCSNNRLTSLDVSGCNALVCLDCTADQLTRLDVSNNTALEDLNCSYNQLTSLDISKNVKLLPYIDSPAIGVFLNLSYMPTLYEVCVWKMPFPPAGKDDLIDTAGSPNVYFTTDCSTSIQGDCKEKMKIDIYPNPSDDIINIEFENPDNAFIEIYNVSGTLILSKPLHSEFEKINLSGFSRGVYLVKVKQGRTVIIKKLIVK
jgi:hypothetical protein